MKDESIEGLEIPALDFLQSLVTYIEGHRGGVFNATAEFILQEAMIFNPHDNFTLLCVVIALFSLLMIYAAVFLYIRRAFTLRHYFSYKMGLIIPNAANICALEGILYGSTTIAGCAVQLWLGGKMPDVDMSLWLMMIGLQHFPKFLGGWLYVIATIAVYMSTRSTMAGNNLSPKIRNRLYRERLAISCLCVSVPIICFIVVAYNFGRMAYHYHKGHQAVREVAHDLRAASLQPVNQSSNVAAVLPYLFPLQQYLLAHLPKLAYCYDVAWGFWIAIALFPVLILIPFAMVQMSALRKMADFKAQRAHLSAGIRTHPGSVHEQIPLVNEFYALIATIVLTLCTCAFRFPNVVLAVKYRFHTEFLIFLNLVYVQPMFFLTSCGILTMYMAAHIIHTRENTRPNLSIVRISQPHGTPTPINKADEENVADVQVGIIHSKLSPTEDDKVNLIMV